MHFWVNTDLRRRWAQKMIPTASEISDSSRNSGQVRREGLLKAGPSAKPWEVAKDPPHWNLKAVLWVQVQNLPPSFGSCQSTRHSKVGSLTLSRSMDRLQGGRALGLEKKKYLYCHYLPMKTHHFLDWGCRQQTETALARPVPITSKEVTDISKALHSGCRSLEIVFMCLMTSKE